MTRLRFMRQRFAIQKAAALAVAFCLLGVLPAASADYEDFDDTSVTKRTEQVIADRSTDGAFVFHDPKLNTDLHLVYEKVKIAVSYTHLTLPTTPYV